MKTFLNPPGLFSHPILLPSTYFEQVNVCWDNEVAERNWTETKLTAILFDEHSDFKQLNQNDSKWPRFSSFIYQFWVFWCVRSISVTDANTYTKLFENSCFLLPHNVFLADLWRSSKQVFYETPLNGCFWLARLKISSQCFCALALLRRKLVFI